MGRGLNWVSVCVEMGSALRGPGTDRSVGEGLLELDGSEGACGLGMRSRALPHLIEQ